MFGKICWVLSGLLIDGLIINDLDIILKIPIQLFFTFFVGYTILLVLEFLKVFNLPSFIKIWTGQTSARFIFMNIFLIVNFTIVWFGLNTIIEHLFKYYKLEIGLGIVAVLSIIASIILTRLTLKLSTPCNK